jgi:SP family facilitated glucose transporter-like MFS transporter 1
MAEGITVNLLFAIFAGAFGSAFQHGYNTGVMNSIQNVTSEWVQNCRETNVTSERLQCAKSDIQVTILWSCVVSIFCLGGMAGGLAVSKVTSSLGIKKALVCSFYAEVCSY